MKLMLTNIFMVSELRYLALPNVRFHSCFPTFTSSSDHKLAWGKLNLLGPVWWDGALFWPVSGSGHVSTRSDYQIFFFFLQDPPEAPSHKQEGCQNEVSVVLGPRECAMSKATLNMQVTWGRNKNLLCKMLRIWEFCYITTWYILA